MGGEVHAGVEVETLMRDGVGRAGWRVFRRERGVVRRAVVAHGDEGPALMPAVASASAGDSSGCAFEALAASGLQSSPRRASHFMTRA